MSVLLLISVCMMRAAVIHRLRYGMSSRQPRFSFHWALCLCKGVQHKFLKWSRKLTVQHNSLQIWRTTAPTDTHVYMHWFSGHWPSGKMNGSGLRWSIPVSGNQDLIYLDATGHSCITFRPTKATVHPVKRSGNLQQPTCALVANAKGCHILSTAAHSPSWRGGCSSCT